MCTWYKVSCREFRVVIPEADIEALVKNSKRDRPREYNFVRTADTIMIVLISSDEWSDACFQTLASTPATRPLVRRTVNKWGAE